MKKFGSIGSLAGKYYYPMKIKINSLSILYAWLGIFSFLPLCLVFIVSILSKNTLHLVSLPFSLDAYTSLLSPLFFKVLYRSVLMASFTCGACLVLAYPFS